MGVARDHSTGDPTEDQQGVQASPLQALQQRALGFLEQQRQVQRAALGSGWLRRSVFESGKVRPLLAASRSVFLVNVYLGALCIVAI